MARFRTVRVFKRVWVMGLLIMLLTVPARLASADEKDAAYLSLSVLGAAPYDQGVGYQGSSPSNIRVGNGIGASLRVGVVPKVGKGFIAIELESFGHGTDVAFPVSQGANGVARTNLWVFNTMANLIVRYPGEWLAPYVGIGGGLSQGVLTSSDIPGRADRDFESSLTLGHQFLAGVQGNLSERIFMFGEYKYVSANYHWQKLSLDFRAQYALAGIGLRF